ncbi:MAG TPA: hypothetical protein VGG39_23385 [Polyangiaceae bacterium]|jgi:hypothetical protein
MTTSDRSQYKQVLVGSLGSSPSVANAPLCIAQDAQRFLEVDVGITATTAATTYTLPVQRLDRPVNVKEVRILPGGALTFVSANYVTVNYGYTNDNSSSLTVMGSIATNNTAANGATGNWAAGTSIVVPPNSNVNSIIPSGSQTQITVTPSGVGVAIPAGTRFQMIVEEV